MTQIRPSMKTPLASMSIRRVCPLCGHGHAADARIPLARAGELKRLAGEGLEAARKAAARKRKREESGARALEDFARLGRQCGYEQSAAWAWHRFSARKGVIHGRRRCALTGGQYEGE